MNEKPELKPKKDENSLYETVKVVVQALLIAVIIPHRSCSRPFNIPFRLAHPDAAGGRLSLRLRK